MSIQVKTHTLKFGDCKIVKSQKDCSVLPCFNGSSTDATRIKPEDHVFQRELIQREENLTALI